MRLRRGSVNLRQFVLRAGERLVDRRAARPPGARRARRRRRPHAGARAVRVGGGDDRASARRGAARPPARRRSPEVVDWSEAGELFADERPIDRQAAALGGLHPVEMSRGDPPAAAQPPARARLRARGRPARRPARGARTRTSRCGSWRGSTRSGLRACSTRWRPTTPPTCSASSREPRRPSCSARWTPRRPSRFAGC